MYKKADQFLPGAPQLLNLNQQAAGTGTSFDKGNKTNGGLGYVESQAPVRKQVLGEFGKALHDHGLATLQGVNQGLESDIALATGMAQLPVRLLGSGNQVFWNGLGWLSNKLGARNWSQNFYDKSKEVRNTTDRWVNALNAPRNAFSRYRDLSDRYYQSKMYDPERPYLGLNRFNGAVLLPFVAAAGKAPAGAAAARSALGKAVSPVAKGFSKFLFPFSSKGWAGQLPVRAWHRLEKSLPAMQAVRKSKAGKFFGSDPVRDIISRTTGSVYPYVDRLTGWTASDTTDSDMKAVTKNLVRVGVPLLGAAFNPAPLLNTVSRNASGADAQMLQQGGYALAKNLNIGNKKTFGNLEPAINFVNQTAIPGFKDWWAAPTDIQAVKAAATKAGREVYKGISNKPKQWVDAANVAIKNPAELRNTKLVKDWRSRVTNNLLTRVFGLTNVPQTAAKTVLKATRQNLLPFLPRYSNTNAIWRGAKDALDNSQETQRRWFGDKGVNTVNLVKNNLWPSFNYMYNDMKTYQRPVDYGTTLAWNYLTNKEQFNRMVPQPLRDYAGPLIEGAKKQILEKYGNKIDPRTKEGQRLLMQQLGIQTTKILIRQAIKARRNRQQAGVVK